MWVKPIYAGIQTLIIGIILLNFDNSMNVIVLKVPVLINATSERRKTRDGWAVTVQCRDGRGEAVDRWEAGLRCQTPHSILVI